MALAQALAREFDAVGVVNDAVEDGVGERGIADQRTMPLLLMGWYPRCGLSRDATPYSVRSFR